MKRFILSSILILSFSLTYGKAKSAEFVLVRDGVPTKVEYLGKNEIVETAIEIYNSDMKKITGRNPELTKDEHTSKILIGVLSEENHFIDILKKQKIDVSEIENEWESFRIVNLSKDGSNIMFVIGSDPRGAAYGIMELLKYAKVSPWVWWADVPYPKSSNIVLPVDYNVVMKPSVKYRGIFINDEDWGLVTWSAQLEGQLIEGRVGPETYTKVYELMLRLRMNIIWPAMHPCTEAFYQVEENKEAAQKYGIVVGTSHCEPMMRNNVGEWDEKIYGKYDFTQNKDRVIEYWEQRIDEVAGTEVVTTLGMRGIHDDKMEGAETLDEQTNLTNKVIEVQQNMLSERYGDKKTAIPQTFVPYKEVLKIYDNGLNLPDNVTLTWCDDNYGYITRLSNAEENRRSGGSGVYYHVSYWGKPHDYLWLATTQPSLIYNEMKKAWDYGAQRLWILNVGDIKPSEYHMQFFADMAWDINSIKPDNIYEHQKNWLAGVFPETDTNKISSIMREYYRLASIRKPEHMGWSRVQQPGFKGGFSPVIDTEFNSFDGSLRKRLECYSTIERMSTDVLESMPAAFRDAYWQLVHYPVCGAAEINRKLLYAQNARQLADRNKFVAEEYARMSTVAYDNIQNLTYYYNNEMANGKWKGMMDSSPRRLHVYQPAPLPDVFGNESISIVCIDGVQKPIVSDKEVHYNLAIDEIHKITIFGKDSSPEWKLINKPDWIDIEISNGFTSGEVVLSLSVVGGKYKSENAAIDLIVDGDKYPIILSSTKADIILQNTHIERNGVVAFNAYAYNGNGQGAYNTDGLGHSLKAVTLKKASRDNLSAGAYVEYDIYTHSIGEAHITSCFIPVHAVNGGDVSYAISVDGNEPQIIRLDPEVFETKEWKVNVLRNQARGVTTHKFDRSGLHKIRIYALSDDMVFDQLIVNFSKEKSYYEIPVGVR